MAGRSIGPKIIGHKAHVQLRNANVTELEATWEERWRFAEASRNLRVAADIFKMLPACFVKRSQTRKRP